MVTVVGGLCEAISWKDRFVRGVNKYMLHVCKKYISILLIFIVNGEIINNYIKFF